MAEAEKFDLIASHRKSVLRRHFPEDIRRYLDWSRPGYLSADGQGDELDEESAQ